MIVSKNAALNGGQLGGPNGASVLNHNFVEPGGYLFSGCSPSGSSSSSFSSPVCAVVDNNAARRAPESSQDAVQRPDCLQRNDPCPAWSRARNTTICGVGLVLDLRRVEARRRSARKPSAHSAPFRARSA